VLFRRFFDPRHYVVSNDGRVERLREIAVEFEFTNKQTQFLSLVKKLSIDNFFTSKSSAAALICKLFNSKPS
jgi:hypothetical protein